MEIPTVAVVLIMAVVGSTSITPKRTTNVPIKNESKNNNDADDNNNKHASGLWTLQECGCPGSQALMPGNQVLKAFPHSFGKTQTIGTSVV